MKLIIVLATCICVFSSNAVIQPPFEEVKKLWQSVLMDYIDHCIEKTGADGTLAERLLPYGEFAEDRKLKCFTRCIGSILHIVGEDAAMHNYNFLDKLHIFDPKLRKQVITQCVHKINKKEDDCDRSFYTSKCIYFLVKKAISEGTEATDKFEL